MSVSTPLKTTVCTDPAAIRLLAEYIAFHDSPTTEGVAALFTPDLLVFGSGISREGVGVDDYLRFLQSLAGTRFRQDPGTDLLIDEEGRLVFHWTLTQGDARLAGGVDTLSLRQCRICRIVGVY